MYFCPKSLCNERSYARHARYFAAGDSLRSVTPYYDAKANQSTI